MVQCFSASHKNVPLFFTIRWVNTLPFDFLLFGNIPTKNYRNRLMYDEIIASQKAKTLSFFRHSVYTQSERTSKRHAINQPLYTRFRDAVATTAESHFVVLYDVLRRRFLRPERCRCTHQHHRVIFKSRLRTNFKIINQ